MTRQTLETLEAQHGQTTTAKARANLRHEARTLAAKLGVPVPEWAGFRYGFGIGIPGSRPLAPPAPPPPPPEPPAIPPQLTAWRKAGHARVVNVRRDGSVSLFNFAIGKRVATFESVEACCAALSAGVTFREIVTATPTPRPKRPRGKAVA